MAERLTPCPKCSSYALEVIKEHNPETNGMNMDVTFRCEDCDHQFEGQTTSHSHQRDRERGICI